MIAAFAAATAMTAFAGTVEVTSPFVEWLNKHGTVIGDFNPGKGGMKPGYAIHWETLFETDNAGFVHAYEHMYVTYYGKRVTE